MRRLLSALLLAIGVMLPALALEPGEALDDPALEARARAISRELRCLVCQNESIDDSEAQLAGDLRRIVREQVKAGRSDAEIRAFLVQRYGEFVLLKPAISWGNAALWVAPFAVVVLGGALLAVNLRRRRADDRAFASSRDGGNRAFAGRRGPCRSIAARRLTRLRRNGAA